jgi:hypothetical protein
MRNGLFIQNFGLRAYLCLTTLAVPSCLKIHDLCGFCWLFARVAVAPALVGFQVDRGRLLFEEVGRQARQFFNVAHRLRQGLANLGAGLNSLPYRQLESLAQQARLFDRQLIVQRLFEFPTPTCQVSPESPCVLPLDHAQVLRAAKHHTYPPGGHREPGGRCVSRSVVEVPGASCRRLKLDEPMPPLIKNPKNQRKRLRSVIQKASLIRSL